MTLEGYGNPQPIHEAARHADIAALRQILGEGVSPNLADDYGSMPLQFLCTKDEGDADNRVACFKMLVDAGADAHAETAKMTPLILAARCGPDWSSRACGCPHQRRSKRELARFNGLDAPSLGMLAQ